MELVKKMWHSPDDKPKGDVEVICVNNNGIWHKTKLSACDDDEVKQWAYEDNLLGNNDAVSEDLNMAAHKASKSPCCDNVFVVGAEKFKEGAIWQKEQMMKDAVDAGCFGFQMGEALFSIHQPSEGHNVGDIIRVIILPSDNE